MAIFDDLNPTGRKGVFYKEHSTRKCGVKKDRLWILRYTIKGKTRIEVFGWATEGFSELDAEQKIAAFRANAKNSSGPVSLDQEREARDARIKTEQAEQAAESRKNTTFSKFFDEVYHPQAKLDKAAGTSRSEERLYRLWVEPVIGKLTFEQVGIEHLNKIKANMAAGKRAKIKRNPRDKKKAAKDAQERRTPPRPLAPRTINYALALIRQVWNLACAVKPPLAFGAWPGAVKAFKKPKVNNQRTRFLTKNEAAALLAALKAKSKDMHDMALLALHCGLRAGEIFNLTWNKVNLTKGELLLVDTKNGESRTTYLTDEAREMLRQRSVDCQHPRIVFVSVISKAASKQSQKKEPSEITLCPYKSVPATFSRTVTEIGLNVGVKDPRDKVVFHSLRHTYASWLVEHGASLPIVRDLMGHKNLIMTSRYSHVSADAQREAIAALNRAIRPAGDNVIELKKVKK